MVRVQMMTFLMFCMALNAWADSERTCMRELIGSPETKRYFPNLAEQAASNQLDQRTVEFLSEVKSFCECHSRAPASTDGFFLDKSARLAHEDACAGKTLGGDGFEVHYEVALNRLSQEIIQRLDQRYPAGVRHLASAGSYNQKMSCLHESILNRCTRSKSLQMGYQCILQITTSRDFSRYEANCPEFRESSSPIPEHNDLLI